MKLNLKERLAHRTLEMLDSDDSRITMQSRLRNPDLQSANQRAILSANELLILRVNSIMDDYTPKRNRFNTSEYRNAILDVLAAAQILKRSPGISESKLLKASERVITAIHMNRKT